MLDELTQEELWRFRETVLKLVHLNDWDDYLDRFPPSVFRQGLSRCSTLRELIAWVQQESNRHSRSALFDAWVQGQE